MVQYDDTSRSAITGTTHGQLGPGDRAEELDCRREYTERVGDGHDAEVVGCEDPEAQIVYGTTPGQLAQMIERVRQAVERFGQQALATAANVSTREVGAILRGERRARQATLGKPTQAVPQLETGQRERIDHERAVLEAVRNSCRQTSLRLVAAQVWVDAANLSHVLIGRTKPSPAVLAKLEATLVQLTGDQPQRGEGTEA